MGKQEQAAGWPVIGTGETLSGVRFYVVPSSSEPGRVHLVKQLPVRLQCDCMAAQHGRKCRHVAAVVAYKQRQQLEQAQAEELAAPIVAQLHTIAETARAAGASRGTPARFGGRSQAAFSLMK